MANGILAASQIQMESLSGTGIMTIVPPATNTNQTLTLPDSTGTLSTMGRGTAVASTSGTSIDFTSIPSWAKRITVMFSGMSTNGGSNYLVQLGVGSVTTSGYLGSSSLLTGNAVGTDTFTTGFGLRHGGVGTTVVLHGAMTLSLVGSNIWAASGVTAMSQSTYTIISAGSIALGGTLDRVRITTVNGTDAFDAGTINIMYEG